VAGDGVAERQREVEGRTEPGALVAGVRAAPVALEQALLIGDGDSRAGVGDRHIFFLSPAVTLTSEPGFTRRLMTVLTCSRVSALIAALRLAQ
jgi:hypothetical protein